MGNVIFDKYNKVWFNIREPLTCAKKVSEV